ncbi:hypothetical protein Tco_0282828 [Tanacetum coccineum]
MLYADAHHVTGHACLGSRYYMTQRSSKGLVPPLEDPEYQFEGKIVETMTEPTMEEYMTTTRDGYGPGVVHPEMMAKTLRLRDNFSRNSALILSVEVIAFYKGLYGPTRLSLDSRGAIPAMKAVEAKKAIQEMAEYS